MPAISVGSVEVDVLPNVQGIRQRLQRALVPPASQVGDEVGRIIGQRIAAQIAPAVRDGINDGAKAARPAATRQGADTGGAFARSLRTKLQEAFRSMPKLNVSLSDTGVDADLARLRARMESLSDKTIGIDISAEQARAQAADIEERLRRLGAAHPNVAVRADTAAAIAQLQAVQAEVDELTRDPARIHLETDGQLGTKLRAAVQQAQASLPNVNITADTTPAELEIARLRAQLTQLSDKRVGIDISATDAIAQITQIQAQLAHLSAQDADVAVRVDAGAAAAQLAAFNAQVNRLDGRTARVDVDTRGAVSGMQMLVTAAIAFGPALLPALPVAAAGLGAIAAAGVAAGVGLASIGAVAIPAFKDIGGALTAQKAAQDAATSSTNAGGAANSQAASKALQMASAQQSLATARRNAAQQIRDAERGVGDAVRQAAQANTQAAAQVKSARTALADAYSQAADRMAQANQQVDQAEKDLALSQRTARQAQLDLTAARAEASRQLQDMNNQLAGSKLSERDAEIALTEATAARNKVLANTNASDLDKSKAILQYDQAVQRLKEQRLETQRLTVDTKAANKAGVDGSATVKSAQEQLASAQQAVVDKTSALKTAQQNVAKTQIENTRQIADAQTKLSEAQKTVAETQRQGAETIARAQERVTQAQQSGADSVASAQRQIASASQSAAGGVDQAALAQAKYQQALAKLTPSARQTFDAFVNLRSAFSDWSRSLQPQVMPIFTRAINGLRAALPALTPFVKNAAAAITELQDRASKGFKSPWWKTFKTDLAGSVKPALIGLGVAFGNTFKGIAGIIGAFLPHMDSISSRMQGITARFANWGQGLKGSPEFERFLSYSSEMAPKLGHALAQLGSGFMNVGQALAPLSSVLLGILGGLAEAIGIIAQHAPWLVQGIWLIVVAMRAWAIVQGVLNFVMSQNPLVRVAMLIGVLVAAVIYAYNRFGWFRTGVQAVWSAIQTAALWAWNNALKPLIGWLVAGWNLIVKGALWLWGILKPVFAFISAAVRILATIFGTVLVVAFKVAWTIVKTYFTLLKFEFMIFATIAKWLWFNVLSPVVGWIISGFKLLWSGIKIYFGYAKTAFRAVGTVAKWLWTNAISPVVRWIVGGVKLLWAGVKLYFGYVKAGFRALATVAKWLWNNVMRPVFNWIGGKAKWLYTNAIKPAINQISAIFKAVAKVGKWLWSNVFKPVFGWIADKAKWLWEKGVKPAFDKLKTGVKKVGDAFESARKFIKKAWDKLEGIAKKPVRFIVNTIYNGAIVPTWNKIASAFGAKKIGKMNIKGWATGGVLPGYTPGRDVHLAALSGGEAVMRPEWTRAIGPDYVNSMNAVARQGGVPAVQRAMGGSLPGFADGGIFGWVGKAANTAAGWGSSAWDKIKKGASWLKDSIGASARAGVKYAVNPLLEKIPGLDNSFGKMIKKIPEKIVDSLFGYADKADAKGASGGGGGIWQKPVNAAYGTPFGKRGSMWSSGRHTGLDFPAAVGTAVRAVADGTVSQVASGGPYGKHVQISHGGGLSSLYAHMSRIMTRLHAHVNQGQQIGKVGATGNVTGPHLHLEARLNGKSVDPMRYLSGSGGGANVRAVGAAQQYAKSILRNYGWGASQFGPLKQLWQHESGWRWNADNPSSDAYGIPQALPGSKMASAGRDWRTNAATQIRWGLGYIKGRPDYGSPARAWSKWQSRSPHWYDQGGYLPTGLSTVYNGTGRPEPVLTGAQWNTLARSDGSTGPQQFEGNLYLDSGEFLGRVRGEANAVVQENQQRLVSTLRAG
ncbi:peptidoglycan DD-metalloendopeptidase family protein [Streptomyces sp. NBC_00006]|uniref:aggregation-promoting factor C-terminal-like domain-containing protein n=1 Tax=Streptomyces sp. NBC_00006 TaxID=2975619 RepID=UPI00224E0FCE|nr:peptidoglycan DD-metalloendopeptidase family protein [Streptomyces sp. NBC_00006]MCX5537717.1 peptidoglycan DD-metalloendopeptidase family protein [Streptomyces sp. NBC_00006]MCX5537872.1 peptidoglycan DD-metalloendopeptidase family protein [Streptomyces sp. NBC_00006]